MNAFAFLYDCKADFEQNGRNMRYIFEPLQDVHIKITNRMYCPYGRIPSDANPWCCYLNTVQFIKNGIEIARAIIHEMNKVCPLLVLMQDGIWYEVTGGRCEYRDGQWMMIWLAYRNTRHAWMMNYGMPAYRDPDIAIAKRRVTP